MAATPAWIGRYRVRGVIGTGGFATVYLATDIHLGVDVAVKVLAENHSLEPEVRRRFIEEGRRLRRVRGPHVVAVHDLGDTERAQPYLVMDWADRGDLAGRVSAARRHGRPPGLEDVRVVARAVAGGLTVLHRHHLVHRDLAPKNLLLCSTSPPDDPEPIGARSEQDARQLIADDEQIVLADLGLSKDLAAASGLTLAAGTSGFAPPEQREPGHTIDHRADVWAASALMLWLVTDGAPDDGGRWQHGLRGVPRIAELTPVLLRGLAASPEDRYPTIGQWQAALERAVAPAAPVLVDGLPRTPQRDRRRLPLLLLLLVVLVSGVLGVVATSTRATGPKVSSRQLDDDRQRTAVEDHGITIVLTAPTAAAVGNPVRIDATVRGATSWLWGTPDGALYQGDEAIELTPRTTGTATVRLLAFDDQGHMVEATHRLTVTEEDTS